MTPLDALMWAVAVWLMLLNVFVGVMLFALLAGIAKDILAWWRG